MFIAVPQSPFRFRPRPRLPRRPGLPRRAAGPLVLACATLLATAVSSAQAAPRCVPADGLRSPAIAQAPRADGGSEITEFLPRGEYRVTRCARDGRPEVSETVSPIRDPDGGITFAPTERREPGLTVSMLYGDPAEPSWASDFDAARALSAPPAPTAAPPETAAPAAATAGSAATAAAVCTNSQYSLWMGTWTNRVYGYYVNRSRFSYNDTSVASIVRGHTNWDTTFNSCGLNDITNLTSFHLGSTGATIHTYRDGLSVTDRGDMAAIGCPGALACTLDFTDGSGAVVESDQRFNEDVTFSNVGASGAYDYQAVATHETGHTIGLGHANSSDELTMFYAIGAGETQARSLAKGDVMGLRARYP